MKVTLYLHLYVVKQSWSKELQVSAVTTASPLSGDNWEQIYKPSYGPLLRVEQVTFDIPEATDDWLRKKAIEGLQDQIKNTQAEAEIKVKDLRQQIDELLMIGYDVGQVTDVTDKLATHHDNASRFYDPDIPF